MKKKPYSSVSVNQVEVAGLLDPRDPMDAVLGLDIRRGRDSSNLEKKQE